MKVKSLIFELENGKEIKIDKETIKKYLEGKEFRYYVEIGNDIFDGYCKKIHNFNIDEFILGILDQIENYNLKRIIDNEKD